MSAKPGLKKKLKSVRAAGKLSKAMKTVSAAKYSKLNAIFKNYSLYAREYAGLCGFSEEIVQDTDIKTVVVFGSNKGFCGGFNNQIIQFLKDNVFSEKLPEHLIVCGGTLSKLMTENGYEAEKTFVFGDIPSFDESADLFNALSDFGAEVSDYPVMLVRPIYKNTMTQIPQAQVMLLNRSGSGESGNDTLFFPDEKTVEEVLAQNMLRTVIYGAMLETALGAQAATLMTMRSAYDTATEYGEALESEIHRQRQRDVTADVIETSSEKVGKKEGDDKNA